jgi:hypothetical protein
MSAITWNYFCEIANVIVKFTMSNNKPVRVIFDALDGADVMGYGIRPTNIDVQAPMSITMPPIRYLYSST